MFKCVFIGFVENVVFNEDVIKNFFDFKYENIKKLEISINGEIMIICFFEFDFVNDEYLRFYLFCIKGQENQEEIGFLILFWKSIKMGICFGVWIL